MAGIENYISELLYDHDCVIVPQLGGFLASNHSSRLSPSSQLIFPPYRSIAFNVYLKQNDGLLANHIVAKENISYTEAIQIINEFISTSFSSLEQGKKVIIAGVGSVFYDKERNIQFEEQKNTNHLLDSFGMEGVHFIPVNREQEPLKKIVIPAKTIRPSIKNTERRPVISINKKSKKIVGGVAIAAALVWFSLNLYLVAPKHYESSSLNPFDSQEIILSKNDSLRNTPSSVYVKDPVIDQEIAIEPAHESDSEISISNNETSSIEPIQQQVTVPAAPEKQEPVVSEPKEQETSSSYLIAGVFKIKENAESLVLQLKQQGFPNAQIISANNRSYVCYDRFKNHQEAVAMTDSLQKKNLEGWIWKH